MQEYQAYTEKLPETLQPSDLGLGEKVKDLKEIILKESFFKNLLSLCSNPAGDDLEVIDKIEKDLLQLACTFEGALKKYPIAYEEPINLGFAQEVKRYQMVLHNIKDSLDNIRKTPAFQK